MPSSNRILVKLQPTVALAAADPRANLRPLHDEAPQRDGFGLASAPTWYLADLPDGGPTPWDLAHAQVADQLGIDEASVLFAEPDIQQSFNDGSDTGERALLAAQPDCTEVQQDGTHNKVVGPSDGWHLDDEFSQLRSARNAVQFADPRTRIAHIDVGYDPEHIAKPEHILVGLDRSFVDGDDNPNSAADPNRGHAIPDNSGHGTGTIGILAGGRIPALRNDYLGGAPQAEILPLRISNSVVLFYSSAFARALQYAIDQRCDVVSCSMGGLPSKAWSEAVNNAYEQGACIVAAAGNNVVEIPSHHVVYPARYHRVIAACGVMANGMPYDHIAARDIQGNWGPDSCMIQALAAYTPNIPWPIYHCKDKIRRNGEGTSSATPQIAAAVALWYERYKSVLPRDWRRIEAVRNALFRSAKAADQQHCGHGALQARAALSLAPDLSLPKTPADSDSFAFLRVITGLGITEMPPREMMFNLELAQRYLANPDLQAIVPDPEASVGDDAMLKFMDAVIQDSRTSVALRKHIANRYASVSGTVVQGAPPEVVAPVPSMSGITSAPSEPTFRSLRAYAVDPSFSTRLDTTSISEVVLKVRWEHLEPGPKGEYLDIVDTDASGITYSPVNLDDPRLLAQDGFPPAEGNPSFHQQMVYAVAMRTIERFELALGRPVLWRPQPNPANEFDDSRFAPRLRIRPHALHQANAFYSPQEIALLFGYFQAGTEDPGDHVPGSTVYACLSHDIVAHETTHAILDGMHRRFQEASNPDVLALHEAFADIVALMQHFTIPEILENQIAQTRGNLETESILGSLAVQFGRAIGGRGALRDAIGRIDNRGVWTRIRPDPSGYQGKILAPHARGALLVAAVFDAFLAIYNTRTADLLRIYTGGTGVLPSGAIHPDLVHRLAAEASKTAGHVLNMCIRALDYVPPVDITFGDYLRAIITADSDLVPDDKFKYRVAFVEAFRTRGIYPLDLNTLSVDTLRWQGIEVGGSMGEYRSILRELKKYADECFYLTDRQELFTVTRKHREKLHASLGKLFSRSPDFATKLGLDPKSAFEVHALRRSIRISPDGTYVPQVIVALTQVRTLTVSGSANQRLFRGGATIVVDLSMPAVKYVISKRIDSATREERTKAFLNSASTNPLLGLLVGADRREPFAALHALDDIGP